MTFVAGRFAATQSGQQVGGAVCGIPTNYSCRFLLALKP